MRILPVMLMAAAVLCPAKEKRAITNEAGNDNVDITANVILDREQIRKALGGAELPEGIVAVEVKIVPKGEDALSVSRDDFALLSHKDGQRSGPYSPSQIAGNATMVVRTQTQSGGMGSQGNGPVWGGIPGTMGRPRRMDDGSGGGFGNTAGTEAATAEIKSDRKKAESPLIRTLGEHMLAEKETKEPMSGLLYFPLEGKVKTKDLELIYKGPAGRLFVNFR